MTEFAAPFEDPWEYVLHGRCVLDVASLCLMSVSVCFHALGGVKSTVVRPLYALSTPLAFKGILFYAQKLPSQASRIHVTSSRSRADTIDRHGDGNGCEVKY